MTSSPNDSSLNSKDELIFLPKPSTDPVSNKREKLVSLMSNLSQPNEDRDVSLEKKLCEKYGKGYKILKSIGYKIGQGLGRREQGISDPIFVRRREERKGINGSGESLVGGERGDNFMLGQKRLKEEKAREETEENLSNFEGLTQIFLKGLYSSSEHDFLRSLEKQINLLYPLVKSSDSNSMMKVDTKNNSITYKGAAFSKDDLLCCYYDNAAISSLMKDVQFSSIVKSTRLMNECNDVIILNKQLQDKDHDKLVSSTAFIEQIKCLNFIIENKSKFDFDINITTDKIKVMTAVNNTLLFYVNFIKKNGKECCCFYENMTVYCVRKVIEIYGRLDVGDICRSEIKEKLVQICGSVKEIIERTCGDDKWKANKLNGIVIYHLLIKRIKSNISDPAVLLLLSTYHDIIKSSSSINNLISDLITKSIIQKLSSNYAFLPNKNSLDSTFNLLSFLHILRLADIQKIVTVIESKISINIIKWDIDDKDTFDDLIKIFKLLGKFFSREFVKKINSKFLYPKLLHIFLGRGTLLTDFDAVNEGVSHLKEWRKCGFLTEGAVVKIVVKGLFKKIKMELNGMESLGMDGLSDIKLKQFYFWLKNLLDKKLKILLNVEVVNELKLILMFVYDKGMQLS